MKIKRNLKKQNEIYTQDVVTRWSFSFNFLPLVRAPIVSGQPTKNI